MRMSKKKEIVPKLRFPEFQGNSIDFVHGNRLFESITNKNHNSDLPILAITQDQGAVPRDQIEYNVTVTDKSLSNYKVVEVGDFIISLRSFQGGIEYSRFKGICSPAYIILRKREENISELYYKYFFKTWKYIQSLNRNLEGIRDGKMISYSQFSSVKVPYPRSFKEQQKIADCLSSIDELIDAETRKLTALEKYKKGLMQKLFPAEGKTLPECRFPEFQGCGEWKREEIGKIGEVITGKTPSTSDSALWDGDIQFVTPTDITENKYQYHTQRTVVKTPKMKVLPKHTIMFTCIASIGKMALSLYPCITNQQINSIVPKSCYNNEFIYYSLLQKTFLIKAGFANSTLPIINKTDFSKIQVPVILDKKEQQKIADCLSAIDTMITEQSNKVEQLKTHKKGLMQGLFPSLEEADV